MVLLLGEVSGERGIAWLMLGEISGERRVTRLLLGEICGELRAIRPILGEILVLEGRDVVLICLEGGVVVVPLEGGETGRPAFGWVVGPLGAVRQLLLGLPLVGAEELADGVRHGGVSARRSSGKRR